MTTVHLPTLRDYRNRARLTQQQLAAQAGVAHSTVWRLEHGHQIPEDPTLHALAAALGVHADELDRAIRAHRRDGTP